jgi:CRP/FNR family transcriptional regulator, cyclic AMP receptor protein
MPCKPDVLKHVPLFSLLDDEELTVLAGQVELREFRPRQRIYKMGDSNGLAYVMVTGRVRVSTIDEDHQEVVVDEPSHGEFFGFASMLEQTPHQTTATAIDETMCIEVSRDNISTLLQRKPLASMGMLTVLGRQFHSSQLLVRLRANRNANEIIEQEATFPQRVADSVVRIGGVDIHHRFRDSDRNLHCRQRRPGTHRVGSLSIHPAESDPFSACGNPSAGDYDESEPAGHEGPPP